MKTHIQKWNNNGWAAAAFILPSMIGFIAFFVFPTIRGLILSFTDWDLLSKPEFIGFDNYIQLFQDPDFWNSVKVTALYVLWNVPVQTVLAVCIALIMDRVTSSGLIRGFLLMPWILSNVVVALLWLWLMDSSLGLLNTVITGLGFNHIPFLTSTKLALPSMAAINIWRHMGYTGLIVFAGLQGIPKEIEEASCIDGAGAFRRFFSIILPYLRPVLAFVVLTSVVGSFQIFDTVSVITRGTGGPVASTYVLYLYIYKNGLEMYRMGFSSAVAMTLFLFLLIVSLIQMKVMKGNETDF
ncbi:MAG: sugar ABC transporter permease [Spirochaetaceae bacterium]|jgi:multiple sugar transport system permease protein|nr:sugar ABC transporter permease [Spirochaetaceae bacterium]